MSQLSQQCHTSGPGAWDAGWLRSTQSIRMRGSCPSRALGIGINNLWGHPGLSLACLCPHISALGSTKLDPSAVVLQPSLGLSVSPGWHLVPRTGAVRVPSWLPCSWLGLWDKPWLLPGPAMTWPLAPTLPWHSPAKNHDWNCRSLSTCFQPVHELTMVIISKLNKHWRGTIRWELLIVFN